MTDLALLPNVVLGLSIIGFTLLCWVGVRLLDPK